jgi:predicted AAA+ superfamily ATPase
MATSNHERVGRTLDLLKDALRPFVEREYEAKYGASWRTQAVQVLSRSDVRDLNGQTHLDVTALITLMWYQWNEVFAGTLGQAERSLVGELRDVRNRWAHQHAFSTDDTYRALDTAHRLLTALSAAEQAREVDRMRQEILRLRFEEQARHERRRAAQHPTEGQPLAGLRPWREVVTPHRDVATGRYQQAEFAADLGQVARGEGAAEYRDPGEFFRRTYLTEGLRHLLRGALLRLTGNGGDPVVELQTNFGGGKTHSMLALYHLFGGVRAGDLAGIEAVLQGTGATQPPTARRAVLVGTALSPANPHTTADGITIRTLWGELAYQLLGRAGYALVAADDERGVSPGSDQLRELFTRAAPCLVLIDEWVAFVRQLFHVSGLPAGSFEANLTFAQALTEAARATARTLVVASIPASTIEIGGEGGQAALDRIKNTFGRVESAWRPASAKEGFEIVRRRLFQPITEPQHFAARDAVVRAFSEMYGMQVAEFPPDSREGEYRRQLEAAYPIHPELFERLYTDWSALDKFQRTRGVLRLMAAVIHELWERQDGSLLIMPGTVPVDAQPVQFELTRYMDDPWVPVIEKDVDGPHSLPLGLDRENQNLGRYSACRRVARTLYLGSAPTLRAANRGLDDRSIKLGCVQPGESVATFGDALRRLTDAATYLYVDGKRYWLSTQPSVTRLAQDRAAQQDSDTVWQELRRRLLADKQRGDFAGVHTMPSSSGDVPDEQEARLVILGPDAPHSLRAEDSPARRAAASLLEHRGSAPRLHRNMLVFLAPDKNRLDELEQGIRQYLAWKSIEAEHRELNLDSFQHNQATTKLATADGTVDSRIKETYSWLLVPEQPEPLGPVEWQEMRLQGQEPLAVRAARKLHNDGLLLVTYSGARLKLDLDTYLWRERDHITLKDLWDCYTRYLYLDRLRNRDVLLKAVHDGVGQVSGDLFAYAGSWDAARGEYVGLVLHERIAPPFDGSALLIKPDVAQLYLDIQHEEEARRAQAAGRESTYQQVEHTPAGVHGGPAQATLATPMPAAAPPIAPQPRLYHGTVQLGAQRLGVQAGTIANEVVQHLALLPNAQVRITMEIEAELPEGAPENVVRTVLENSRTLKFASSEFEE